MTPPAGYLVSNLDPLLNSFQNSQIYIPNFVPGFAVGLPNFSIDWKTGDGYAKIGYSVGPWDRFWEGIPHLAVGPQCCNFVEVPHTQQFTQLSWGNHYYSRAGLGAPGINVQNYTATYGSPPAPVGLRTDWNWTVRFSLDWSKPELLNPSSEWGAIGIAVTQYVPNATGKLVYTLINFWMDPNSSASIHFSEGNLGGGISPPGLVVYHPIQMSREGNQTMTIDLSPYLIDTLKVLGLPTTKASSPLITYVYLNVEGYNFRWNTTLWSFYILTPVGAQQNPLRQALFLSLPAAGLAVGLAILFFYTRSTRTNRRNSGGRTKVRGAPRNWPKSRI